VWKSKFYGAVVFASTSTPSTRRLLPKHWLISTQAYSIAGGAVIEYEIVSSAPDGEQLADDYEELGGGRCAVM